MDVCLSLSESLCEWLLDWGALPQNVRGCSPQLLSLDITDSKAMKPRHLKRSLNTMG